MYDRRLIALVLLMIVISLSVGGTAISLLYQTAFEQEKVRLTETAQSQARLMEAIARFDAKYSLEDVPGGAVAATLSQIEDAHAHHQGFGETGAFVIGKKEGDHIVFLDVYQRGEKITVPPAPWGGRLAIPMQKALAGHSGAMVGLDYRNQVVLAAYEHVSILDIGIVVKIDLAEMRRPFITTGMIVLTIAIMIILIGSMLFFRIGNPILAQIRGQNKSLKEATERLNKAQEMAHLGNWNWAIAKNELWWSDGVYRIFGCNPRQFIPTYDAFIKAVHIEDRAMVKAAASSALATLKPYDIEHRIIKLDGTECIVHELGEIQLGNDGKPEYMVGTVQDITSRKNAEKERLKITAQLEEALLFNKNILEQSPIGIAIYDQSGQCILANKAMAKHIGATKGEVLKQNFHHIESWRKTDLHDKALSAINNHRTERTTISTVSTFGKSINLSCHLAPFISKGHILLLLMIDDITSKIKAEKALNKSEETVRLLLNSTAEAIYGIDLDGRCTFANPACVAMLGYGDVNELLNKNMHKLIHYAYPDGTHYPLTECHIYKAFQNGKGVHIDNEVLWKKDGTSIPVEYWSHPVQQENNIIGAVITFLDVAERKAFEQQLEKSKVAAEAANLAKSQFLASMSHEIRTPMNAIIGIADHLQKSELTAEDKGLLSTLNRSANNLLDLINDILDLSKIEAGQMDLDEVEFDLNVLIYEIDSIMEVEAAKKGIKLKKEIDPLLPKHIQCGLKFLRQVLLNLTGNAIKFTHEGEVSIKVTPYGPTDEKTSDGEKYLHFTISDTGIGIPAERFEEIFNRFTQADSSVTRKYGGTGLGLAISKEMVTLMGGKIWVESKLEKGSTFHFTVKYKEAAQQFNETDNKIAAETTTAVDTIGSQSGKPFNILAVEDSEDNTMLMKLFLKATPYQTDYVENGELAVQQFKKKNYDMVLMDMQMPVKDGYTATSEIRAWEEKTGKHKTSIIAVTANALKGEEQKCFTAGCSGYLSKPFNKQTLLKTIETYLQDRYP